jgi:hypothetical protein
MHFKMSRVLRAIAWTALVLTVAPVNAGQILGPYTDSTYFTKIAFGDHSHYLQPWRAYLETMPAQRFLNGVGLNLPTNNPNPDVLLQMLSRCGIKTGRIEIGWGNLDYQTDTLPNNNHSFGNLLQACKKWGIRPLILLNANQGVPCPLQFFNRTATAEADSGSKQVQLDNVQGLVIGKSGINNLTGYWAAEGMVTAINGNVITISKALPKAIPANATVPMALLKYSPFSVPGSADYNETMAGWKKYVGTVSAFVTMALGTVNSADKGFDLEIWNELTFGSAFLSINNYFDDPKPYTYSENDIWNNLVDTTAAYITANSDTFLGVRCVDGFSNTIPWTASSQLPERINALSKHPYAGRKTFPKDEQNGTNLDAGGNIDAYVPSYTEMFPEYFGCAIQTETMVRDMGPITNSIYGTNHGRYARLSNPCWTWITEVGIAPSDNGITDTSIGLALKAKTSLRYYAFFLNKGVENQLIYSATDGNMGLGIVLDKFVDYTEKNAVYPTNDSVYLSPACMAIRNLTTYFKTGLDEGLTLDNCRNLTLLSLTDSHDHYQFTGNGSTANPNLYDRDVFAFLPFQVNASRFVVAYYVMTRDVQIALNPEQFTMTVKGFKGTGAQFTVYDPLNNQEVPLLVNSVNDSQVSLTVTTADYPYLLTVQEKPNSAVFGTTAAIDHGATHVSFRSLQVLTNATRCIDLIPGVKQLCIYTATGRKVWAFKRDDATLQERVLLPKLHGQGIYLVRFN